jgi:hypothetical protein
MRQSQRQPEVGTRVGISLRLGIKPCIKPTASVFTHIVQHITGSTRKELLVNKLPLPDVQCILLDQGPTHNSAPWSHRHYT